MEITEVTKIIIAFFGWVQQILNALGINAFDEAFKNAADKLN